MSGVVDISPIKTPDLKLTPEQRRDVSMFITCWTLEFMCMAIALGLGDPQVSNIAEVGEYLKLCLGFTIVSNGGKRRRQRGGVDDDKEIETALAIITAKLPPTNAVVLRQKIQLVKGQLVEARKKALGKFQEGPSMANRLVRLLASAGIAFMPIADKLINLGLKLKSEQYKAAAAAAAVTAPVKMAVTALGDATLTAVYNGAVGADIAFAAVGKVGVESAQAAAQGVTGIYSWLGQTINDIQKNPGTRAEGEKQVAAKALSDLKTLNVWADEDANFARVAGYEKYFNSTADILSQQPPQALESGTDITAKDETEGAQIVKRIRAEREKREQMSEAVNVLAGFKNFMSPFNTYMFMMAYLFKNDAMTYIKWSNVLGMTIAGIVAEDPVTVVLCITWVMSALVGVSWVARLLDALTAQVEVKTSLDMERASAAALELRYLEEELRGKERGLQALIPDGAAAPSNAAAPPAAQGGRRRLTSRHRRRHAPSLPRRTRRSSSGRRQRSSRRRRE
jgi:hypothetical protein